MDCALNSPILNGATISVLTVLVVIGGLKSKNISAVPLMMSPTSTSGFGFIF